MSMVPEHLLSALSGTLVDGRIQSAATRVYLALLRMERPSRELLIAQGIPAATLDPVLTILNDQRLIRLGPSGGIDVPPPLTSIPHHALDLERRAKQVRAAAHELTQVYYNARPRQGDPDSDVTVLRDLAEVGAQSNLIVAAASTSVVSIRAMSERTRDLLRSPLESHREPSIGAEGTPLTMRTVWDTQVLDLPGAIDVLGARVEGGEQQRFLSRVPVTVVVADSTACLLEWSSTDGGPQGVLLRSSEVVTSVLALVDRFWELAAPMTMGTRPTDLDPRDATILRLMAAGVPDASIARQSGVSQRTVERRIRSLMDRLSAETRFQAGVQAVHRGWL